MAASFRKSFYDKNCLDLAQIVAIFYVTFKCDEKLQIQESQHFFGYNLLDLFY